jgi:hypothetical protein
VLSSAHALRPHVVPRSPVDADRVGGDADTDTDTEAPRSGASPAISVSVLARRLDWAALLRRVWGEDVTTCPRCAGQLRVMAFATDPDVTARILGHLGLAPPPLRVAPARAPPELPWSDDPA